jgi:hypothetical protein
MMNGFAGCVMVAGGCYRGTSSPPGMAGGTCFCEDERVARRPMPARYALRVSDLLRYPTLDPDPAVEAYKPGIDVTLLRENLKLTPDQRVRRLVELQRAAEELRRAGREAKR